MLDLGGRTAACELRVEPGVDDHLGQFRTDHPGAQGQNLGIVALLQALGGIDVVAGSGEHAFDLVGDHRHAESGAADQNAPVVMAFPDLLCQMEADFRVVRLFPTQIIQVCNMNALLLQVVVDDFFQIDCRFVAIDRDTQVTIGHGHAPPLQFKDIRFDELPGLQEVAAPDQSGELRAVQAIEPVPDLPGHPRIGLEGAADIPAGRRGVRRQNSRCSRIPAGRR